MVLHCAILDDLPGQSRQLVRLRGPDARRFLQGSVSGDVDALDEGHAVTAALLTVKGKLISELVMLPPQGDSYDVLVPAELADAVAESFDRHIVMDDVVIERVTEHGVAMVWDDEGDEPEITGADLRNVATRHPLPALMLVGPVAALRAALADATAVDAAEFDRARIESATPGWGAELKPGFFPPEIGFVYAVSYDKGCYMGQEPLARIHARGQVNRVMVRVVLERATAVPTPVSAETREDAGTLTTCVAELAGAGGLAIVRRELAVLGTVLSTTGDAAVAMRVISGPLGDDPGITKKS